MAWTAHKDPAMKEEIVESDEELDKKAQRLADLIRKSRHFVAFTGAGISTSAGIPDFRGPDGVWTLRDEGRARVKPTVSTLQAVPTPTHMALIELQRRGLLKYLISQNTDGLHRRSGFPTDKLSELHGNSNLEVCKKCGAEYLRDFHVRGYGRGVLEHHTDRNCAKCGGVLYDTIINFSEALPQRPMIRGFDNARNADLMLVLGSSLTVTPAANMPQDTVQQGGKLAICNMQRTPLDPIASLRVFGRTDDLMRRVMDKLGIDIPPFALKRLLRVGLERRPGTAAGEPERRTLTLTGLDRDGTPASYLRRVDLSVDRPEGERPWTGSVTQEPFRAELPADATGPVRASLRFQGNYYEPNLPLEYNFEEPPPAPKQQSVKKPNFAKMSTAELKRLAQSRGLSGVEDALEKSDIVRALEEDEAQSTRDTSTTYDLTYHPMEGKWTVACET